MTIYAPAHSTHQQGMTLIEITVVIVALAVLITIGVSATLFSLTKARDSERKTDTATLASVLESYHNTKGKYPLLSDIQAGTIQSVTPDMLSAPGSILANSLVASSTPTTQQYGYITTDQSGATCSSGVQCGVRFTLYWQSEQDKVVYAVKSIK